MRLYLHPTSHQLMSEALTKQCKINPADCEWIETNAAPAKRVAREWFEIRDATSMGARDGHGRISSKERAVQYCANVSGSSHGVVHVREVLPDEI